MRSGDRTRRRSTGGKRGEERITVYTGMGPAALGRFLHHYFPNMEIDHVEIDQQLVDQVNATLPLPVSPKFQMYPHSVCYFFIISF